MSDSNCLVRLRLIVESRSAAHYAQLIGGSEHQPTDSHGRATRCLNCQHNRATLQGYNGAVGAEQAGLPR